MHAPALAPELVTRTKAALAREDLRAYHGWLAFLLFEAETGAARRPDPAAQANAARRLEQWLDRISADPAVLGTLTGVLEWAYWSAADDSGQPFKIAIPSDYDPSRPAALSVYLHGYTGDHMNHSTGLASQPGVFQVAVLGRSRGGGYRALSEADVLDVIAYVQKHWAIDPDQIHLNGGSMGGGGTLRLGARYPHRWASGRPTCGYAGLLPPGNLVTFPIYSTHSTDDYVVPVLQSRAPLQRVLDLGGQVILDETTGLGHAAWDYAQGNARGAAWVLRQKRPDSRTVMQVDYTATDGGALRGWWGEVVEWGPGRGAARFVLSAGRDNQLYVKTENIARLRLLLAEAPVERSRLLSISVDGGLPLTLEAPLPEAVVLVRNGAHWEREVEAPALPFVLRSPGGANLLYNGEPLLIVHGTTGTAAETEALKRAAVAASRSPGAGWAGMDGEAIDGEQDKGEDGVPHSETLFGHLRMKADHDVTADDLARCHLVLLGTAAQNALVKRMAGSLPLAVQGEWIQCSDGTRYPAAGKTFGLVHYNPLSPQRRLFWVASADPAVAAPSPVIARLMGGETLASALFSADLLITEGQSRTLVAARAFTSRWQWQRDEGGSLPPAVRTFAEVNAWLGEALLRATGADFALVQELGPSDLPAVVPGLTRVGHLEPFFRQMPVGHMTLTGRELTEISAQLAGQTPSQGGRLQLLPAPSTLSPERHYTVALPGEVIWTFTRQLKRVPSAYALTAREMADVLALGRTE